MMLVASLRSPQSTIRRRSAASSTLKALKVNFFGFGGKRSSQEFGTAYVPVVDFSSLQSDPITCDPDFPCADENDEAYYRSAGSNRDLFFQDFWMVIGIPILTPFVAFLTFENVSHFYQGVVEFLSTNTWVAVDGGGKYLHTNEYVSLIRRKTYICQQKHTNRTAKQVVDTHRQWFGRARRGPVVCDADLNDHYHLAATASGNPSSYQYGSGRIAGD
jgi:hypothetical protein